MPPKLTDNELNIAIRLLRKSTSINAVSAFLKDRTLLYSATSWDMLRDQRIKPALAEGKLDRIDIVKLLRDAEEFGRQHVALFQCSASDAVEITNSSTLKSRLAKLDLEALLDAPRIVETTSGLQLVDIRIEQTGKGNILVAKFVDTRRYREQIGRESSGTREIITYELREDRVVNVVRIHANGFAEVRLQSHKNAVNYAAETENVFAKLTGIADRLKFSDFSLGKARRHMMENRQTLAKQGVVRFGEGLVRSKKGGALTFAAANFSMDMFTDDEEIESAMATVLSKGKGRSQCDTVNCTWLKLPNNAGPSSDVHTYIGGRNNEFHVVPQCSKADYEYVLEKIKKFAA